MIFVDNAGVTDPQVNLALEEYVLRHFDPAHTYLLFYINEPSVIIGRNQNTLEEINADYVDARGIHVVRRLSGGGAVYHDLGNLNYSIITDHAPERLNNFAYFTEPVLHVLRGLGVEAALSGRNDLVADGRKISGTAQFSTGKRMLNHGTLLFDSDLGEVVNALDVKMTKIQSKGLKSVRSRVANIAEFLDAPMPIEVFRDRLLRGLLEETSLQVYHPTEADWGGVEVLAGERYRRWDWNFGASPPFNLRRTRRFEGVGEIDLRLDVEQGRIRHAAIYGDFLGHADVEELARRLEGVRYEMETLRQALEPVALAPYFGELPREAFLAFLFGPDEPVREAS